MSLLQIAATAAAYLLVGIFIMGMDDGRDPFPERFVVGWPLIFLWRLLAVAPYRLGTRFGKWLRRDRDKPRTF